MKVSVTFNEQKLVAKMKAYQRVCGKEVKQLVHNGARLCCVELARVTQPYGTGKDAKTIGEAAISKDIQSITKPLNDYWLGQFEELFESGDDSRSLRRKDGSIWLRQTDKLVKTEEALHDFHQSKRLKSNGRTSKAGLQGDRTFGQSRGRDIAVVSIGILKKYIKLTQKKVGIAKAGWAAVALLCKADVRAPLRGIPQWVTRNMISGAGSVNDKNASGLGWEVVLENKIRYSRRTLSKANEIIACNIAKGKMIKMMNAGIRYVLKKEAMK